MFQVLSNSWALLLGMGLIMLGNGLQGSLLGVRASIEGFETSVTGLIMSGYFIGIVIGCQIVPRMVAKVGHIRIFGALASLASTAILVQAVFITPWLWWAMRLVTGFSYAGIYIVAESWLNEASENRTRGQLLSIYMLISLGGMAGGQLLLNLANPSGYDLFVLVSLLVSLATIPILVTVSQAPSYEVLEKVGVVQLYRVAPIGIFGMFLTGMAMGTIFGMGAVFTTSIGMSVKDVSFFMGTMIIGGFIFQYPLGWMSDRIGRRSVIIGSCLGGAAISFFATTQTEQGMLFFAITAVIGGMTMPLYSLCSVQTNDYLTPEQMVPASGTLVLLNASGAALGAPITAAAMEMFGPDAFFGSIGVIMSLVALFSLWRMTQRADISAEDRGDFVVMAPTPLSVSLSHNVELEVIEAAASMDSASIQTSFEDLSRELENPVEER
ncbi:MAG: MFS transporter [SAR324 cluster bacterium]|nr:MFS transporter [SAR324 cluster bacterium]